MLSEKFKKLNNKFWFRLFLRVGIIIVAFVLLLTLCNTAFLSSYYEYAHKKDLISVSDDIKKTDLNNSAQMISVISTIEDEYGFEVEVYSNDGRIIYSSVGGQMMQFFFEDSDRLHMHHRPLDTKKSYKTGKDGVLVRAVDRISKNEYLVYRFSLNNSAIAEVRTQIAQIKNSAAIANTFITIIAVIFLVISIFWVLWFSRKISKPISDMNRITRNMAQLDFAEKLIPDSGDEIGQLAVSINDLSVRLNDTMSNLNATNAKLKNEIELERQLDNMRRGFVANVSHELKTPISIIQGYAEGLKVNINADSKEKYIDTIIDESHRMNKLVLSLLNLSRYEAGQVAINPVKFSLCPIVLTISERIFAGKNINLSVDIAEDTLVLADLDQIEQVLKSYLENAASHVNVGGDVKISAILKGDRYCVTVYNSGSHIDEEIMPQIWQSFYRGDKSHNRESGRFGLGLSIAAAIVKGHGEDYGVYNAENGVCFWFTIKAATKN